ncbi:MAG: DcaP family trimeric outer membrane transporter [Pseudomonadota bacterium]
MYRIVMIQRVCLIGFLTLVSLPALAAEESGIEDTRLTMGGFVRLHALLGDVSDGAGKSGDQKLYVPHIPVTGRPDSDRWRGTFHAKDSRIWFRSRTPAGGSELETLFEFDLHDSAQDHRLRVRHAYVRLGPLLAGQTYTAFTNVAALADLDAAIAVGDSVTRHDVLRWTQTTGAASEWVVSLEEPVSRVAGGDDAVRSVTGSSRRPDVVLRWNRVIGAGNVSISGMSRGLRGLDHGNGERDERQVYAVSMGGRLYRGPLDNLRFTLAHGEGWARYATPGTFFDALQKADGTLEPVRLTGGTVSWQHFWKPDWRTTLAFSQVRAELPAQADAQRTRRARSAHANLIRSWGQQLSLGLEYVYGHRLRQDGRRGQINRVQVTARVNFDARILP